MEIDTDTKPLPRVKIALVDFGGTGLSSDGLVACAAALQIQMQRDFAAYWGWGHGLLVRAAKDPLDLRDDEWLGGFFEHPDVAGALGYHDVAKNGQPIAKAFPRLDEADGVPWQPTMSHELIELSDFRCTRAEQGLDGQFWAAEHADAVESDTYSIKVNGVAVPVSNFVTQDWYDGRGTKYDFLGLLKAPLTCTPGGYAQYYDPQRGWQQVYARHHATGEHVLPRPYRHNYQGRRAKRAENAKAA
jgi:hypothetical protein